jgi:hypothetical protein
MRKWAKPGNSWGRSSPPNALENSASLKTRRNRRVFAYERLRPCEHADSCNFEGNMKMWLTLLISVDRASGILSNSGSTS